MCVGVWLVKDERMTKSKCNNLGGEFLVRERESWFEISKLKIMCAPRVRIHQQHVLIANNQLYIKLHI